MELTNKEKKHLQSVSRLLAKVLRHTPDELGVTLDAHGWVSVPTLLKALDEKGRKISLEGLYWIVETSSKKRFTLTPDGQRIRAAQGHSIGVDLALRAITPPDFLFHGTAAHNIDAIRNQGLIAGQRQHVHLSANRATATQVGARHGAPVVLTIDTSAMITVGLAFYQADNGVWLTNHIAPHFINFDDANASIEPSTNNK